MSPEYKGSHSASPIEVIKEVTKQVKSGNIEPDRLISQADYVYTSAGEEGRAKVLPFLQEAVKRAPEGTVQLALIQKLGELYKQDKTTHDQTENIRRYIQLGRDLGVSGKPEGERYIKALEEKYGTLENTPESQTPVISPEAQKAAREKVKSWLQNFTKPAEGYVRIARMQADSGEEEKAALEQAWAQATLTGPPDPAAVAAVLTAREKAGRYMNETYNRHQGWDNWTKEEKRHFTRLKIETQYAERELNNVVNSPPEAVPDTRPPLTKLAQAVTTGKDKIRTFLKENPGSKESWKDIILGRESPVTATPQEPPIELPIQVIPEDKPVFHDLVQKTTRRLVSLEEDDINFMFMDDPELIKIYEKFVQAKQNLAGHIQESLEGFYTSSHVRAITAPKRKYVSAGKQAAEVNSIIEDYISGKVAILYNANPDIPEGILVEKVTEAINTSLVRNRRLEAASAAK